MTYEQIALHELVPATEVDAELGLWEAACVMTDAEELAVCEAQGWRYDAPTGTLVHDALSAVIRGRVFRELGVFASPDHERSSRREFGVAVVGVTVDPIAMKGALVAMLKPIIERHGHMLKFALRPELRRTLRIEGRYSVAWYAILGEVY